MTFYKVLIRVYTYMYAYRSTCRWGGVSMHLNIERFRMNTHMVYLAHTLFLTCIKHVMLLTWNMHVTFLLFACYSCCSCCYMHCACYRMVGNFCGCSFYGKSEKALKINFCGFKFLDSIDYIGEGNIQSMVTATSIGVWHCTSDDVIDTRAQSRSQSSLLLSHTCRNLDK